MDQDLAVKLIMRHIQWDEDIPFEYQGFVKKYLNLIYVMGYDEGHKYLKVPRTTQVKRIDKFGNETIYASVKDAAYKTRCNRFSISKALMKTKEGKNYLLGYRWEIIPAPLKADSAPDLDRVK